MNASNIDHQESPYGIFIYHNIRIQSIANILKIINSIGSEDQLRDNIMALAPSGHVFYQDEYTQKYEVQWSTVNGVIDITTIVMQPYVWGEPAQAKIENGILYRKGIVTVHRQAIEIFNDGYIVIAEGSSQYYDYIQMNYNCEPGPMDNFKYHLNNSLVDETTIKVVVGSHWADPDDGDDALAIWCDLNLDGTPILINSTEDYYALEWVDIWPNMIN